MSMKLTNIRERTCRFCAFCKYWYDPANSAIEPEGGSSGFCASICRRKHCA